MRERFWWRIRRTSGNVKIPNWTFVISCYLSSAVYFINCNCYVCSVPQFSVIGLCSLDSWIRGSWLCLMPYKKTLKFQMSLHSLFIRYTFHNWQFHFEQSTFLSIFLKCSTKKNRLYLNLNKNAFWMEMIYLRKCIIVQKYRQTFCRWTEWQEFQWKCREKKKKRAPFHFFFLPENKIFVSFRFYSSDASKKTLISLKFYFYSFLFVLLAKGKGKGKTTL